MHVGPYSARTELSEVKEGQRNRERLGRLKERALFYIPPLTGKPEQQRFTMRGGVLIPTLAVSSAAQLAASHCPKERTLEPQSAARQDMKCIVPGMYLQVALPGEERPKF